MKQTAFLLLMTAWIVLGCSDSEPVHVNSFEFTPVASKPTASDNTDSATVELVFSLQLDRDVYEDSDWGDPPQFAIWLEDEFGRRIRTVWVSYRTGTGDWVGKVECPVALPYWVGRYNKETGASGPPTVVDPVPDTVTGATPRSDPFQARASVEPGTTWNYFIEVNCSGDFNAAFPSVRENGAPDPNGNGQPSLIWRGEITAKPGVSDSPQLIGRTEQYQPTDIINPDLTGITSAGRLFSTIEVYCR